MDTFELVAGIVCSAVIVGTLGAIVYSLIEFYKKRDRKDWAKRSNFQTINDNIDKKYQNQKQ